MYMHEQVERAEKTREAQLTIHNAPFPLHAINLRRTMRIYLTSRRLSWEVAEVNNWYPSENAGDTEARVVIPAKSTYKSHNFWQARALREGVGKRYQSPSGPRLDAITVVYPIDPSVIEGYAVVVEGPMDALAAAGLGRLGIALMGNTPSLAVLNHAALVLQNYKALLLADSDALVEAGKITGALAARGVNIKMRKLYAKDLAEADGHERREAVKWED